jgi:ribosomal RNA assembly protein
MTEYTYELRIPEDRIAVLIGKGGDVKKELEEATGTKIRVDSNEGEVFISGEDAIKLLNARETIRAIGRGFNPEIAILLLKVDYVLELIDISDYGKTKNDLIRLKGRVIGREGKSRKLIEELTETYISVYGKTIGIIGEPENVSISKRAVESLLSGSTHGNVYKWLEKQRREIKKRRLLGEEI